MAAEKPYCLTIEVKGAHIEGGLGYMVAFRVETASPQAHPEFKEWSAAVRKAVTETGDKVFHHDAYTRKLAIAGLMHELDELNNRYNIQIGFIDDIPAVQIHSTNPQDTQIEADFTDEEGNFRVIEKNPAHAPRAAVHEDGKTGIIEAGRKNFPFDKPADDIKGTPPAKPPRPAHPKF